MAEYQYQIIELHMRELDEIAACEASVIIVNQTVITEEQSQTKTN